MEASEHDTQAREGADAGQTAEEQANAQAKAAQQPPAAPQEDESGAAEPAKADESAESDEGAEKVGGLIGDQGQPAQPVNVGAGDPNVPVRTAAPPPAAQRNIRVDEGAQEQTLHERSPQEHGAGGS